MIVILSAHFEGACARVVDSYLTIARPWVDGLQVQVLPIRIILLPLRNLVDVHVGIEGDVTTRVVKCLVGRTNCRDFAIEIYLLQIRQVLERFAKCCVTMEVDLLNIQLLSALCRKYGFPNGGISLEYQLTQFRATREIDFPVNIDISRKLKGGEERTGNRRFNASIAKSGDLPRVGPCRNDELA